ncbi:MAG TPA: MBOAT family O-acyltransferase [Planctomycetota bacterium]|nr:MBOAT family O-acyltransferase [Planctomycetota bacterium]
MEFHRLGYPLFLLATFGAALLAGRSRARRNAVLLAASALFYASLEPRFVALLAGVTFVAYVGAPFVAPKSGAPERGGPRRAILALLIALELSGLVVVKYAGFVARTVNDALAALGSGGHLPVLEGVAIVGVSFYTFQAIGYLVDVYRGALPPERDLPAFALFVGFFPQVLAGPIGRATALLPQWKSEPRFSERRLSDGLFLLLSGAAKKVLIGDFLATRLVDPAFAHPGGVGALGMWLASYGFAFQLYGDFAGYSEMAIGSARCLGIDLPVNFDAPFRARSIQELWQRWHISLSTWIRDYVFLPMQGRSPSRARTYAAAIGSMGLCGLWHGASFAWIGWGLLHGTALALHQAWTSFLRKRFALKKRLAKSAPWRALSIALTFHFFVASLLVVRTDAVFGGASLATIASELVSAPRGDGAWFLNVWVAAALALAAATHFLPGRAKLALAARFAAIPRPVQGGLLAASALALFVARPSSSPFVYTNF